MILYLPRCIAAERKENRNRSTSIPQKYWIKLKQKRDQKKGGGGGGRNKSNDRMELLELLEIATFFEIFLRSQNRLIEFP